MESNWRSCSLGDALTLQRGFDLPLAQRVNGPVPVIASTGQVGWHNRSAVTGPGVVIGRSGSLGGGQFIEGAYWPLNTTLWVKDFKGNDPRYCYYLLKSIDFRQFNVGSGVPTLNRNHVHPLPILLPPIDDQRRISGILAALDERIDNLRQTSTALEAIAQALFKSWFVDFDPVRAKTEGREPEGMDAATSALFSSEFVDSELGRIPKGWAVGGIYDVANVRYGAPFKSALFNVDRVGRPLVRIRDLRNEEPGVWTPEEHPNGYLIKPGDVIAGMDGEFRAYLWGGEEAWLNQRVCAFHPRYPHGSVFVRNVISPLLAGVEATVTATTVIHLGKKHIDEFRVLVPPAEIALLFSERVQPLYERVVVVKQHARTSANLRDTLLPRLISGRLRIPEAKALVAEAAGRNPAA